MAGPDRGAARRAFRSVGAGGWKAKAKNAAASLKAEYQAGKRGDESPTTPIWATPTEQLDALRGLLRAARSSPSPASELDADADEVAHALRGVDWAGVRAATADKAGDAMQSVRALAGQVDWAKVQPVAAHVSRALIAAVASGQIGIGGRLGSTVARAIVDEGGLAQRVAVKLDDPAAPLPPDFRQVIDTTGTEV